MKRASIVVSAVMMSVGFASTALAAPITVNGYVCAATYTRQPNVTYGQGYVVVQVNTGANCTGSFVGNYYYLGSGASSAGYQYSEAERLGLFERATQAATQGTSVSLYVEGAGIGILNTTYRGN
ncbi:hypothetical protein D7Y15_04980 [Corallococcus sp. AB030]|uniref:hypothetical protein n=1 Tax=Corallococcus TaxID=83461 RepID=UPI000EC305A3|nr:MULTISPECIES: hypothetical protein [Corallococcus]NNB84161.1 hypothetical protein [Corallococcus exiguus]RKI00462.1 hypothetical protein D7Y04_18885 [Corallococcus sp. AB038B]RKI19250.1 hypothetical protein D7Y15_04980 [Corallococcus sp. AB030]